jgi:bifunctional non-homologous end joining protein LigD
VHEQEFVVGGYTLPSKGGIGIGALLLGYYEHGKLIYAGRSGTGFSQAMRTQLRKKLDALTQKTKPFAEVPAEYAKDALWVRPELVVHVHFASWTSDGLVRQAAFDGIREDKPATEVVREEELLVAKHARKKINACPLHHLRRRCKVNSARSSPDPP